MSDDFLERDFLRRAPKAKLKIVESNPPVAMSSRTWAASSAIVSLADSTRSRIERIDLVILYTWNKIIVTTMQKITVAMLAIRKKILV